MNQPAIFCDLLNAREKSCVQGAIGFGFTSHWFKNSREIFITKRSNCKRVIALDSILNICYTGTWPFEGNLKMFEYSISSPVSQGPLLEETLFKQTI